MRSGSTADSWRTTPIRSRQTGGAIFGSSPRTRTSPEVRSRKPSRISTVVVFPAPFGPRNATISAGSTSKPIPFTASKAPYDFLRLRTLIAASSRAGACSAACEDPTVRSTVVTGGARTVAVWQCLLLSWKKTAETDSVTRSSSLPECPPTWRRCGAKRYKREASCCPSIGDGCRRRLGA